MNMKSAIKPFIVKTENDHDVNSGMDLARLHLRDGCVATGLDFSRQVAVEKAIATAIEYGLKQGWIKQEEQGKFCFGTALTLLKTGVKIARAGWNGKNQWLSISCNQGQDVKSEHFWSIHNADFARANGGTAKVAPCITLKNAQDEIVMGWIPSTGDLFANDWVRVE